MITDVKPQSDKALKLEKLERIRHTCAHVLAMAVQNLYPETKVTIGPVTDNGFYYDFDRRFPFTPKELKKIQKKMKNSPFESKRAGKTTMTILPLLSLQPSLNNTRQVSVLLVDAQGHDHDGHDQCVLHRAIHSDAHSAG